MRKVQKILSGILSLMGFGMIVLSVQTARAQANHDCITTVAKWNAAPVFQKKTPVYRIDPKFTATEQAFIKKAITLAVERIQDKALWQDVSRSYGFAHPKTETLLNSGFCNSIDIQRNILFHQLYYLSRPLRKGSADTFPNINIKYSNLPPKDGELGWVGYAYYNKVKIFWDDEQKDWKREGDFEIYLNQYFLQQGGIYANENYWAGTIAHEMLHNLGHQHPDSSDAKYNQFQINILANIVRNYGLEATAGDMVYPKHSCDTISVGDATAGDI